MKLVPPQCQCQTTELSVRLPRFPVVKKMNDHESVLQDKIAFGLADRVTFSQRLGRLGTIPPEQRGPLTAAVEGSLPADNRVPAGGNRSLQHVQSRCECGHDPRD